jgi:hypothetical protein
VAGLDSAIGYASATLTVPISTARTDSLIGFGTATLTGPAIVTPAGRSDSPIGFAATTLFGPAARTDSPIGFRSVTLTAPHRPIVMRTADGYRRTKLRMFDAPLTSTDTVYPDTAYPA